MADPLPRIGDVERYLIRQRPHFIADFLIRSIIRTRLFNDYLGSLTNTPVIQRILGFLTITTAQKATILLKRTKPRRRIACSGVHLCAEIAENPYFKRFSGIEIVHRNSIKITVDLWRRWRDSNSRVGLSRPTAFRVRTLQPLGYISVYFRLFLTRKIFWREKQERNHKSIRFEILKTRN